MTARRSLGAIFASILATLVPAGALAAPGSVSGTVSPGPSRGEVPERNRGFVARAANPLKPPRTVDPLPYVVVVLEDGPVDDGDRNPPREPVRYSIVGESFASKVLPIVTGASVELKNDGKGAPRVYFPAKPDLTSGDPINPKGVRVVKKLDLKYEALELRDHDSAHFSGWVVGFPHPYVARVDEAGRFQIKGVPPGAWKVKVWYRDGWLAGVADSVTVVGNRDAQVKLTLPAALTPAAAGKK